MGVFKGIFRSITRPYRHMTKGVWGDIQKTKENLGSVKSTIEKKPVHRLINAQGAKAAFETLYKENGWDEKQLKKQLRASYFAKWWALGFFWLSICLAVGVMVLFPRFWIIVFAFIFGALMCINFAINALRYAVFQAQIEDRTLYSVKEYWSLKNKWARLFS